MKSYQQFFAELKRRRVFKVTAVYGAVAFVLLQVAELLGQGLRLPDSFMPFITAVILLGFPLALILTWAFEVTPEGVQRTSAAAPGEIEGMVAQPASQRWPAGALALLGVVALLAGAWWAGRRSAPEAGTAAADADRAGAVQLAFSDPGNDPRPSIAVLPFVNMSADENQEYFSDGMTEEILNTLARIDELRVSGRTSAFAYKGRSVDLRDIGDELGVRYLIEGSVRKAGDQLRITAQLIDATDGSHLWSDQYDRTLEDVFAIQTEIAEAIADALTVPLGLEGDETLVTPTGDLAAYDLYLAGRTMMRERGASLLEAERLFEAAIARDSSWAPAWAALAETREIRIWYPEAFEDGTRDSATIAATLAGAERAARRALDLDPRNASALVALGSVQRDRGEWTVSEATYRRALAIDPDNAEGHQQYGELLYTVGRVDEGVRSLDRATALDPALIRINTLGWVLQLDDRLEEAIAVFREGVARDPQVTLPRVWGNAGTAYMRAGQADEAIEIFLRLMQAAGPPPGVDPSLLPPQTEMEQSVRAITARDLSLVPARMLPFLVPDDWMMVGQPDSALAALQRFRELGGPLPGDQAIWQPIFDPLRGDPRYQDYMRDIGLPDARLQRTPVSERTRPLFLQGIEGRDDVDRPGSAEAP